MNQAMPFYFLLQEIGDKMVEISKIADKLKELNSLLALNDNAVTQLSDHVSIQYIEDIQIFGKNMPFISWSEVKNAYFMIYTFSRFTR